MMLMATVTWFVHALQSKLTWKNKKYISLKRLPNGSLFYYSKTTKLYICCTSKYMIMEHLTDLKDIVIISKPFIDPIISTLITPQIEKLKSFLKKKEIENKVVENFFENKFEEYLYQTYKKCSIINVLVFPNQQIKIKDIYIPLSIKSSKDHTSQKINTFDKKYIEKYNNILISDNAGMGKSTLTKWISLSLIEQSLSIPILIELKKINSKHDILSEIFNQINPIDKSFDQELILKFLE